MAPKPHMNLTLKEAYKFIAPSISYDQAKIIQCKDIPSSKSMFIWKLVLDKLPTNDNLMYKGCQIPYRCNLCKSNIETSKHLFFNAVSQRKFGFGSTQLSTYIIFHNFQKIGGQLVSLIGPRNVP